MAHHQGFVQRVIQRLMSLAMQWMSDRAAGQFEADARAAEAVSRRTLLTILRRNGQSEWGRTHDFLALTSPEDFRDRHPLTTYADYEALIQRVMAGEKNLLTADPILHLGLSSGTTGKQKHLPITRRHQNQTNRYMMMVTQGLITRRVPQAGRAGRGLVLMSASAVKTLPSGLTVGPPTGSGLKAMLPMAHLIWTSPPEAFLTSRPEDALYLHLLFALRERTLQYISAPFSSAVLDFLRALERHQTSLIQDLRQGRIAEFVQLSPERRASLEASLQGEEARAEEVVHALAQGMQGIVPRLWPQLTHLTTVAAGPFKVYGERLRPYLGQVPVFSAIYACGEAMMGVTLEEDLGVYALTPSTAFFEFIPLEQVEEDRPPTRFLHELTVGARYEVVLTNHAGLYRYRLGDVVEVKGYFHKTPLLEFLFRRGQLLNLCGEKTSEAAALTALQQVVAQRGALLTDFTSMADTESEPNRYRFYVEATPEGRLSDGSVPLLLDRALKEANPFYEIPRAANRLDLPEVIEAPEGTFAALREQMIVRGASRNQAKVPRLLTSPELQAWMERQVR